ncbi:unnamed protein product [Rhizoctonia solani]|uniref:DUF6535 domain-containing protein n=1 Tax=Rhizoctonia solani TaxID=456999 RepID=A0A8H3HGZ0_9AGAM|nr:unnamed protein product [Rhizoctonia solani]
MPSAFDPYASLGFDEYGTELGKEARVWKVYVKETDKWDAELVDGWNKSLDVTLIFAALFSAISTAFIIESTGALQDDPTDVTAQTLLQMYQALYAIANNSAPPQGTLLDTTEATGFTPSRTMVIVNILWYLSLALSIATSFLAILAKDWCHSFMANRSGHPCIQARRRQRKWTMIEQWKMQELIAMLPLLIHMALLLIYLGGSSA